MPCWASQHVAAVLCIVLLRFFRSMGMLSSVRSGNTYPCNVPFGLAYSGLSNTCGGSAQAITTGRVCVCQRGTDMVAEKIERKLINHSNDDLPLHDKVVCPLLKDGDVHVQDFFHGFPRHVHGYFRGQSAFGYFPPSSTVGVGNPTGVLTNTRALVHLSATAWLIGLCPVLVPTRRQARWNPWKDKYWRGALCGLFLRSRAENTEADVQKLMKKTNIFCSGPIRQKDFLRSSFPEVIEKPFFCLCFVLFSFVCELGRRGALPEFGEETWCCFR